MSRARRRSSFSKGDVDVANDLLPEAFARFAEHFQAKYGREPFGAFAFTPRIAYAWRNSDFRGSVTRFELGASS
jgi:hypothetical protein